MNNREMLEAELILHNISKKDLAKLLNLGIATVSKKFNGRLKWSLEEVNLIASIIGQEKAVQIFLSK